MILLDTNILVDLLRGNPDSTAFILALPSPPLISVLSIAELRSGARQGSESLRIDAIVRTYVIKSVTLAIAERAGAFSKQYRASHGVDMVDALIAATADVEGLPFATLNLKHFPMFPGLARPY